MDEYFARNAAREIFSSLGNAIRDTSPLLDRNSFVMDTAARFTAAYIQSGADLSKTSIHAEADGYIGLAKYIWDSVNKD